MRRGGWWVGCLCITVATVVGGKLAQVDSLLVRNEQGQMVQVHVGMRVPELLRLVGPAKEKQHFETSRQEIWLYAFGGIVLKEGVISSLRQQSLAPEASAADDYSSLGSVVSQPVSVSPEAEALLSEIMREIPSEPDGPETPSSSVTRPAPVTSERRRYEAMAEDEPLHPFKK